MHLPEWFDSWRDCQMPAIETAVEAFQSGARVVCLEGPPGTGKTIIAESVRQMLDRRGLYVCSSNELLDQFHHDFPYSAALKGRINYPTLNFPEEFYSTFNPITTADCDKNKRTGQWACSLCYNVHGCHYQVAKGDCLDAELGCTNIHYAITEWNGPAKFSGAFPLVIVDECDLLESIMRSIITVSFSARFKQKYSIPEPTSTTRPDPMMQKVDMWVDWAGRVLGQLSSRVDWLLPAIESGGADPSLIREKSRLQRLCDQLTFLITEIPEGGWVHDDYKSGTTTLKPVRVSRFGEDMIWRHAPMFLCMSGTIVNAESWMESVGADHLPYLPIAIPSTFPAERRPIRIMPAASMSEKNKDVAWPLMAEKLKQVVDYHEKESILVHTVSYSLANYLHEHLDSDRTMVYKNSSERSEVLAKFKETTGLVLIAPSLDRGVDLPDDLCRVNIVAKIPYPNLGDKQVSAILYEEGRRNQGQVWYTTETIRYLIQELGRGMRHEEDSQIAYILDSNFLKLHRQWGHLIPQWVKDAYVWGGEYEKEMKR